MQTGDITAPRLSSPISTLADLVGRSGSHDPRSAPWVENRVDFKDGVKGSSLLLLLLLDLCRGRPP